MSADEMLLEGLGGVGKLAIEKIKQTVVEADFRRLREIRKKATELVSNVGVLNKRLNVSEIMTDILTLFQEKHSPVDEENRIELLASTFAQSPSDGLEGYQAQAFPGERWEVPAAFSQILTDVLIGLSHRIEKGDASEDARILSLRLLRGNGIEDFGGLLQLLSYGEKQSVSSLCAELSYLVQKALIGEAGMSECVKQICEQLMNGCEEALESCVVWKQNRLTFSWEQMLLKDDTPDGLMHSFSKMENGLSSYSARLQTLVKILESPIKALEIGSEFIDAIADTCSLDYIFALASIARDNLDSIVEPLSQLFKSNSTLSHASPDLVRVGLIASNTEFLLTYIQSILCFLEHESSIRVITMSFTDKTVSDFKEIIQALEFLRGFLIYFTEKASFLESIDIRASFFQFMAELLTLVLIKTFLSSKF
jgi:hypothetical protein